MITIEYLKKNNLILFEAISGSKAFGLATKNSDTDIRGVFYLPKEKYFGLEYISQVSNETNDEVYYELGRYVQLLLKNNPNCLEVLATPKECVIYKNPIMDCFKLEDFISKLCKETFGGYALAQIQKAKGLKKKMNSLIKVDRKTILDFCFILNENQSVELQEWLVSHRAKQENCGLTKIPNSKGMYGLYLDCKGDKNYKGCIKNEDSNELSVSSINNGESLSAYLFCNLDAYSMYCKEYREYWKWVSERNENRYETNQKHGKNYDSKNMMHTIRLLQSAVHIFEHSILNIKVDNREKLLAIKNGECSYENILLEAENLTMLLEKLHHKSLLPEKPNYEKVENILVSVRTKLYGKQ